MSSIRPSPARPGLGRRALDAAPTRFPEKAPACPAGLGQGRPPVRLWKTLSAHLAGAGLGLGGQPTGRTEKPDFP
jgi:hypothetical protein